MSDLISDPTEMTFTNDCRCLHRGHQPDCPIHGTPLYGYPEAAPSVSSSAPALEDFANDLAAQPMPRVVVTDAELLEADVERSSSAEPAPPTTDARKLGLIEFALKAHRFVEAEDFDDGNAAGEIAAHCSCGFICSPEGNEWVKDHRIAWERHVAAAILAAKPSYSVVMDAEKPSLSPVQEEATPTPSSALGSNESVVRTAEHGEVAARFGVIVAQPTEGSAADLSGDNVGHDAQHETQLSVGESNTVMLGHGNSLEGSTLSMRNFSGNRPPDPIDPPIINDLSASMFVLMAMHDSLAEKDGVVVWWQAGRDSMTHRASAETVRQATARIAQLEKSLAGSISERETLTAQNAKLEEIAADSRAALTKIAPPTPTADNPLYYPLLFLLEAVEARHGQAPTPDIVTRPHALSPEERAVRVSFATAIVNACDDPRSTSPRTTVEALFDVLCFEETLMASEAAVARLTTEKAAVQSELENEKAMRVEDLADQRKESERANAAESWREQAIQDIEALPSMRLVNMDNREVIARDEVRRIFREAPTNG